MWVTANLVLPIATQRQGEFVTRLEISQSIFVNPDFHYKISGTI
jgi:hypothetical protein